VAEPDHSELRRRSIEGLRAELSAFGSGAPGSRLLELPGLIAAVAPATPERSIFNSVWAADPASLLDRHEQLVELYAEAGVRAWTVWVDPEADPPREELVRRGHVLDGEPRVMALALERLPIEPAGAATLAVETGDPGDCTRVNDLAYGIEGPGWEAVLSGTTEPPLHWWAVREEGRTVSCLATAEQGDDVVVTGVATLPEARGRGLAGALLHHALRDAAARGMRTSSLQASAAGAPVYTRLGFADLGAIELWERRAGEGG
jgi:GNAT superfamily N-acetyltransferase